MLRKTKFLLAMCCTSIVGAACTEHASVNAPPPPPQSQDISRFVTGNAATQLDAAGSLVITGPQLAAASLRPTITQAQARQYAELYARDFGPLVRSTLERDRRGKIDFGHLSACGRTFFAESPLQDLPDEVSPATRRAYGSWWLVSLCERSGAPALSIAVSVFATNLSVIGGRLRFPGTSGGEFVTSGIPRELGTLPISPENAVQILAKRTGALVSEGPRLITSPGDMPQMARWHLVLDRPVLLRGATSGRAHNRADYFFGRSYFADPATIQAPVNEASQTITIRWRADLPEGGPGPKTLPPEQRAVVAVRPGLSVAFEAVTSTPED